MSRLTARQVTSPVVPKVITRAAVREAMAATRWSSALSTAVPDAGRASTISPLAAAIASTPPNSPTCAVPTLSTAATVGGAMSQR